MDGFQFLFPDRNDPESIEELLYNPPPESKEIQLGKTSKLWLGHLKSFGKI